MAGTATQQIAVMGALGRGLRTLDQLEEHLPLERRDIVKAVGRLIERGMAEREEIGVYHLSAEGTQALADDVPIRSGPRRKHTGVRAVGSDTFIQRAWGAMRLRGRFQLGEIVMLAARPGGGNPADNLRRYVQRLVKAGYVAELPVRAASASATSNGFKIFLLVRDTGEQAPMIRRGGSLLDRNTGEEFSWRR